MPGRGYPKVTVRLHAAVLARLTAAAAALGMDRAVLVRELIRWWLEEPGAQLPDRPGGDGPPADAGGP